MSTNIEWCNLTLTPRSGLLPLFPRLLDGREWNEVLEG